MLRLLPLLVLLVGCSTMDVTLLVGPRTNRDYTEIAANLTVAKRFSGRKLCAYQHESEIKNGPPFNSNEEQTSDFLGCGIRWSKRN